MGLPKSSVQMKLGNFRRLQEFLIFFIFSKVLSSFRNFWQFHPPLNDCWALLMTQLIKNPPAMQETQRHGFNPWGEDPLEKEMAISSILAWKIPWAAEPGRLQSMGLQRVRHD